MVALFIGLQGVGFGDDRIPVGEIQDEERTGMDIAGKNTVNLRCGRPVKQHCRVVAPVVEYPIEHEADVVSRHHRHLARGAEQPAQVLDRLATSSGPIDDFNSGITPGRRKEMSNGRPAWVAHFGEDPCGGE